MSGLFLKHNPLEHLLDGKGWVTEIITLNVYSGTHMDAHWHFVGIELGYFQMEKFANSDNVPPIGALIYCFPIIITHTCAGWVRAVATFSEWL